MKPGQCPSREEIDDSFEREDREAKKRGKEFVALFLAIVAAFLILAFARG